MADIVNAPSHYTRGGMETIEFIEAKGLGFRLGNVVKYISRAGHKDAAQTLVDLKKARWYLEREIAALEGESAVALAAWEREVLRTAHDDYHQGAHNDLR